MIATNFYTGWADVTKCGRFWEPPELHHNFVVSKPLATCFATSSLKDPVRTPVRSTVTSA